MPTLDETVWRQHVTLELSVLTVMAMHGNLCLALRHTATRGPSTQLVAAAGGVCRYAARGKAPCAGRSRDSGLRAYGRDPVPGARGG